MSTAVTGTSVRPAAPDEVTRDQRATVDSIPSGGLNRGIRLDHITNTKHTLIPLTAGLATCSDRMPQPSGLAVGQAAARRPTSEKGMPVSLSRTQFGKAAPASAALATTGVVGFPRAAWAANTASTGQPNSFSAYTSGIRLRNTVEAPLHNNHAIRLDLDDGSSTFRADGTFFRVAGLADDSWSSFRSYNLPTHHLRHQNYVLRIDPISSLSSAADRQDATFRVTS